MHTSDSLSKSEDQGVYVVNEIILVPSNPRIEKLDAESCANLRRSRNLLGEQALATKRKKTRLEIQDDCDKVP